MMEVNRPVSGSNKKHPTEAKASLRTRVDASPGEYTNQHNSCAYC